MGLIVSAFKPALVSLYFVSVIQKGRDVDMSVFVVSIIAFMSNLFIVLILVWREICM